jgi:hypothetical protein
MKTGLASIARRTRVRRRGKKLGLATHSRWGLSALDRKAETRPSRALRFALCALRCALRVARCALRVARWALRVGRWALGVGRCALRVGRWALRVGVGVGVFLFCFVLCFYVLSFMSYVSGSSSSSSSRPGWSQYGRSFELGASIHGELAGQLGTGSPSRRPHPRAHLALGTLSEAMRCTNQKSLPPRTCRCECAIHLLPSFAATAAKRETAQTARHPMAPNGNKRTDTSSWRQRTLDTS